ncbi:GxGYxYP domain-containing protein [Clostridium chrysemydis]|uniref:GxGYxYP domain-containing protein n=1 Tax=Clostridium chrysemydis TaxID=2665504 RepID=UPI001884384A|nr:GxGYxYP domain-containing protein [Clostridium chrysemydis]
MKKYFKFLIIAFLSLIFSLFSNIPAFSYASNLSLVLDTENSIDLPKNFRKCADSDISKFSSDLNLTNFDNLKISGSAQFTEQSLDLVLNAIGKTYKIIDVDLREESHGFINGLAVSFKNSLNNANAGLSLKEIKDTENELLSSIKLNEPLNINQSSSSKKVIIPTIVENEENVCKKRLIDYYRIPVTDGNLPSPEMVSRFVNFVNSLPENAWLHFHCKAGVGRTTTFMIMYDIMKNCDFVSLKDIIDRQIFIANLSEANATDFKTGRRLAFFTEFYNSCKSTKETLASVKTPSLEDDYIKSPVVAKNLYVISENDMSKEEQTMISTLQGLVSKKSKNQIYITTNGEPDYNIWLNDLKNNYNVSYKFIRDPFKLIKMFQRDISGYVLYSNKNYYSINNACTLASLKDSIVIDETLESNINKIGIKNLAGDCRNTDKTWAFDNLWDKGLNHSTVIELSPEKSAPLRDYAIMSKSLVFYEEDINDSSFRKKIFSSMDENSHILGWGPDEHTNVKIASTYGVDMIAADWSYNLSVLSAFKSSKVKQKKLDTVDKDGVHYVTFIMSDGDNLQWLQGSNYSSKDWFGSKKRGNFNLGWSLSQSLYYLSPTIFKNYYAYSKKDCFVVPPSGNGYMYPSQFPKDKLGSYTKKLNDYMEKSNQNYVLILDDESLDNISLWDNYTKESNIKGLFYLNYNKNNSYYGKTVWSNNKPIVSCRDLLWGGLEDENTLIKNIDKRVNKGFTKKSDINSYTFVYVHVWSNTMDNVQYVINKLNENPKVSVVTPNNFMELISTYVKDKK